MRRTASRAEPVSASSMAALNWRSSVSTSCWSYMCRFPQYLPVTADDAAPTLWEAIRAVAVATSSVADERSRRRGMTGGHQTAPIGGRGAVPPPGWARLSDRILARLLGRSIDDKLLDGRVTDGNPVVVVRR